MKKKVKHEKNKTSHFNNLWIILTILVVIILILLIQNKILNGKNIQQNKTVTLIKDCGENTIIYNFGDLCWQKLQMPTTANWTDANLYCKNLTLANHSNWRLPEIKELESIKKYMQTNSNIYKETHFWSSTIYEYNKNYHNYFDFRINYKGIAQNFISNYGVKCIRTNLKY